MEPFINQENNPVMARRSNEHSRRLHGHTRAFKNLPQPHMCIQDYLEGSNQPCFINVMSWEKMALPLGPDDCIPLYGGMQVSHTPSSHAVFAVMANPQVLRLKGKNAVDPRETHELVLMMIDFVELMNRNRDLHFTRRFQVLHDRDLAGELKNVWNAVLLKHARDAANHASFQHFAFHHDHRHQQKQYNLQQRQVEEELRQQYQQHEQELKKEQLALMQKHQRYHQQKLEDQHNLQMLGWKSSSGEPKSKQVRDPQTFQRSRKKKKQSACDQIGGYISLHNTKAEAWNNPSELDTSTRALTSDPRSCDKMSKTGDETSEILSLLLSEATSSMAPTTTLRYREQEYFSSTSESDCTSDEGNSTDAESDIDENDSSHVTAQVMVTVGSGNQDEGDLPVSEAVDTKVLKNGEIE